MRHRVAGKKLGRKTPHRKSMFRNLVTSFLDKERIRTTLGRAKAVRPIAERMITLGKRESLHARRQALAFIRDAGVVSKLFGTLAPRFAERAGGYTRIIRLGFRDGDGAQMALLELIGSEFKPAVEETKGKKKKKEKKDEAAEEPKAESKAEKKTEKKAEKKAAKKPAAKTEKKADKKADKKKSSAE